MEISNLIIWVDDKAHSGKYNGQTFRLRYAKWARGHQPGDVGTLMIGSKQWDVCICDDKAYFTPHDSEYYDDKFFLHLGPHVHLSSGVVVRPIIQQTLG